LQQKQNCEKLAMLCATLRCLRWLESVRTSDYGMYDCHYLLWLQVRRTRCWPGVGCTALTIYYGEQMHPSP